MSEVHYSHWGSPPSAMLTALGHNADPFFHVYPAFTSLQRGQPGPVLGTAHGRGRDTKVLITMLQNFKALIVVLAISSVVFALSKPLMLRFEDEAQFRRRRNIWLVLTVLGFTIPSIWLYALVAMPLMFREAKKDDNPMALYVLLAYVIPSARVQIPTIGIGMLFELSQDRMMALVILVPLMFRTVAVAGMSSSRRLTPMDWTLVALGGLQLVLAVPYESPTNTLRRALIFFMDTFVLFYMFARIQPTGKVLKEVAANLVLSVSILAAVAIFESSRGWLLYVNIGPTWGAIEPFSAYLMRGSLLRAQASMGHSLTLGFMTAMGLGLYFYFFGKEPRKLHRWATLGFLIVGCLVTGSRGAWVTVIIVFTVSICLRPNAFQFVAKVIPVLILGLAIAYNSPLKESVMDRMPIIGNTDQDTVAYRQQIADVSWRLIKMNPLFGDPFALRNMEELRQGQGIIDIMNGYANVAIFNGGVGFLFFVSLFAIALWRGVAKVFFLRAVDLDLSFFGATLVACLVGALFFVGTAAVDPPVYWLTGMLASFCNVAVQRKLASQGLERVNSRSGSGSATVS